MKMQVFLRYLINYRLAGFIVIFSMLTMGYANAEALSQAASTTVTGQVLDETGVSIPGVTVKVKGTVNGTITDLDGQFTLVVQGESPMLLFTFIGLISREVKVQAEAPMVVTMQEDAISISELVVVGYGTQDKESVLSAIDQVSGDNIERMGASNVSAALSGLSPGLYSVATSGQPGDDASELYIRGRSSMNGDQALVVVDGIKIEGGFEYMDPEEISSISILKDAAATAVYGVEGANGVVIVTTKRGHKGRARVSVNSDLTIKQPTDALELLGSYDSHYLYNIAAKNDNQWDKLTSDEALMHYKNQDQPYLYPDVDWYGETVRDFAFATRDNISISGGTDLVTYFTTVGYSYEGDAFKPSDLDLPFDSENNFQKMTYRVNLDFNVSPTTSFRTDFAGRFEKRNESGDADEMINNMFEFPSWATPKYYPSNILEQYPDNDPYAPPLGDIRYAGNSLLVNTDNPYLSLYGKGVETRRRNVLTANFVLKQDLDFLTKGLSMSGRFNLSANYLYKQKVSYSPQKYMLDPDGTWANMSGDGNQQQNAQLGNQSNSFKKDRYYYSMQFDYRRSFGNHNVTALGLWSRSKAVEVSSSTLNFPDFKEDWVGRVTYNFRKKYLVEFSGAYNGTDRFLPGSQFGFFPSGSIGWDMAKESFIKDNLSFLDQLKVRYGIGQAGSESGTAKRMYYSTYENFDKGDDIQDTKAEGTGDMYFGDNFEAQGGYMREAIVGNADATWETATKQNLGVDFSMFKDRLSGSVELFNEHRVDIFRDIDDIIPYYYGSTAEFRGANLGEVKKQGYEVSISFSDVFSNGLSYYVKCTYGYNENRVIADTEPTGTPDSKKLVGKTLGMNEVYITDGYLNSIDDVANYVTPGFGGTYWQPGDLMYVDYNGDGLVEAEADKIYYGLAQQPKSQYGITIGGQYKNWSAKVFASGVGSRHVNGSGYLVPFDKELAVGARDIHYDYWTPENLDAAYPTLHAISSGYDRIDQKSTFQLLDSRYFRIKNVELAYNIHLKKNSVGLDRMKVFVSGYNLLTISGIDVGDPELTKPNTYPVMKRYTLGFKFDF